MSRSMHWSSLCDQTADYPDYFRIAFSPLGPCPTIRIWTRSVPKFMSWYFLATSVTNSWHFLTLLDDSWTVGRTKNFWKFVEHVQKICDSLISLARSWTLIGPSWQRLSGFLMVSQLFLTRLGRSWRERKIGVNFFLVRDNFFPSRIVKSTQDTPKSHWDTVKKPMRRKQDY